MRNPPQWSRVSPSRRLAARRDCLTLSAPKHAAPNHRAPNHRAPKDGAPKDGALWQRRAEDAAARGADGGKLREMEAITDGRLEAQATSCRRARAGRPAAHTMAGAIAPGEIFMVSLGCAPRKNRGTDTVNVTPASRRVKTEPSPHRTLMSDALHRSRRETRRSCPRTLVKPGRSGGRGRPREPNA